MPVNTTKFPRDLPKIETEQIAKIRQRQNSVVLQMTLPFWDDERRGMPNSMARSALFGITSTKTDFVRNLKISSLSNYQIIFTGVPLGQDDLSVWLSLVNIAKNEAISEPVVFTGYKLIKDLGWRMHSDSYEKIRSAIQRLKQATIEISTKDQDSGYVGSLIRDYAWNEKTITGREKWSVRFEPKIASLFAPNSTTLLHWNQRKKIGARAKLALWMHNYYSTHSNPLPVSIERLHELTGSMDRYPGFRRSVRVALAKLVTVGLLARYKIENDLLSVARH